MVSRDTMNLFAEWAAFMDEYPPYPPYPGNAHDWPYEYSDYPDWGDDIIDVEGRVIDKPLALPERTDNAG